MKDQKLTPRQKKLIQLMPKVEASEITQEEALRLAGYGDVTARQQSVVLGHLRQQTKMQEALQKAQFTEEYLASGIVEGTGTTELFGGKNPKERADYRARALC